MKTWPAKPVRLLANCEVVISADEFSIELLSNCVLATAARTWSLGTFRGIWAWTNCSTLALFVIPLRSVDHTFRYLQRLLFAQRSDDRLLSMPGSTTNCADAAMPRHRHDFAEWHTLSPGFRNKSRAQAMGRPIPIESGKPRPTLNNASYMIRQEPESNTPAAQEAAGEGTLSLQ
jgi:hypothetical protein